MVKILNNPRWTHDETTLALALYLKRRQSVPSETDPEVIALSDLLRKWADKTGRQGNERFRNPTGVSMKLGNLRRLDKQMGHIGLSHGSKTEDEVWALFADDPDKLAIEVARIRTEIRR